jgi:hypothetical protein
MSPDTPEPDEPIDEPIEEPPPRAKPGARLARFVLLGGALLAGAQLLPQLPRERRLTVRLEDAPSITSVEVTWVRDGRDEPVAGSSFRFTAGSAPRRVESTLRLPDGPYDVDVVVVRGDEARTVRRRVTLEGGDEITLSVPR